jgi:enhancing lycopene biosynthesis protein 2
MLKIGVLLSGCGVYDGAEIQEAVLTLLSIDQMGAQAVCIGIDAEQHHVVNHLNGEEMTESRNMLVEAARIARGDIQKIENIVPADIDALVIPGGFGSAKNLTSWAFDGPLGSIRSDVKLLLVNLVNIGKPIVALCVSPIVLAKAFEGSAIHASMTIGSKHASSPYEISGFEAGLQQTGAETTDCALGSVHVDHVNNIITAPCYMMEATISEIHANIQAAFSALKELLNAE